MRIILAAAAAIALSGAPALAQERHDDHHPDGASSAPMDMSKMTAEEMHRHCAAMMGGEMQGRPNHNHTSDKLGHAPTHKPPSEAEMKAMHEKCAAMMSEDTNEAAPAKP